jgi:ABC-type lipoprotein export system ATPase subunit
MNETPVLQLEGVSKSYRRGPALECALDEVSLSVRPGQTAAVLAGRGQGKTTLVGVASGMLVPDRGSVLINDCELTQLSDRALSKVLAREIGIATRTGPAVRLTVAEYLETALSATRRWDRSQRRERVDATLDWLELRDCSDLLWDELSNWQRVLVEFGQAVIVGPQLMLIDDTLDGLPHRQQQKMLDLIANYAEEFMCAVLMAVSDHSSAMCCSRVWELREGRLTLMYGKGNLASTAPVAGG